MSGTQVEDIDDLLGGLGSDDLDILDLEHDGDGLLQEEYIETDPFLAPADSTVYAPVFATARGVVLPPPSTTTMDKIRKLFDEDPAMMELLEPKKPRLEEPTVSLFTTGSGGAVRPPSAAIANPAKLFGEDMTGTPNGSEKGELRETHFPDLDELKMSGVTKKTRASSFTTGAGSNIPPVSRQALNAVSRLFGESNSEPGPSSPTLPVSGFQTGTGKSAPPPNKAAMARALAILGDTDVSPNSAFETPRPASRQGDLGLYTTPFRAPIPSLPHRSELQTGSPAPFTHPMAQRSAPLVGPSTPSRPPLQTTTNTFTQPRHPRQVIDIKTPLRRIGLASTPGAMRGKAKRGFVTPFKTPGGLSRNTAIRVVQPEKKDPVYTSVFDLTPPPERKSYSEAFLHPQYYQVAELEEMGIPDEIWQLGLSNAVTYQFIADDASLLTNATAFETLRRDGADLVTQKWVDNHYSMILWKLAGQTLSKPQLFDERWRWSEVVEQLKYRYEREYGFAQRPIVRRICEHDSSPSVPMILCVSGIHRPAPVEDEQGKITPVKPFIELTDGWYRINAEVDECLTRAIAKGKITVGRKLAMSGSRLESGSDGEDVLDALGTTRLVLSGNSCHLARWDAKLGLQLSPFAAGLSSLTLDGGSVVLMDVMVSKMYPLAYMSGEKGSREAPWGEDEERVKQDQWKERYTNERTRLQERMRKQLELIEDLTTTLASYAQEVDHAIQTTPSETIERDFDQLLSAKDPNALIRSMAGGNVVHLATFAQHRMQSELVDGQAEIEAELEVLCPKRQVRDFRIVRVVDAQRGVKEPARAGMLNVWEAKALGDGMLQEGKRYLVSNLVPARTGDWSLPKPGDKKEIYLHTRRDTRWKMVESNI